MSNPFNVMNPMNLNNNPQMQQAKKLYQMFSSSQNPQQLFQQMAMQNPQLQQALRMIRNGINPQQVFNQICQQRGINPQELMKMLNSK